MSSAVHSTLLAILHDHGTMRRLLLLAGVVAAMPAFVGVQAMNAEQGAHRVPQRHRTAPQTAAPALPAAAQTSPLFASLQDPMAAGSTAQFTSVLKAPGMLPARPFHFAGSFDAREQAVGCLAAAAWYEAGNDAEGQRSVIQVVLNRVKHPAFPKTVCGVVLQGSQRHTGCQFSFTCDGSLERRWPSQGSWQLARLRAESALDGAVDPDVAEATHYHADYVTPWWSSKLVQLAKVGRHMFYRWPGSGPLPGSVWRGQPENPLALPRLGIASDGQFVGRKSVDTAVPAAPRIEAQFVDAAGAGSVDSIAPVVPPAPPSGALVMPLDLSQPNGRWAVEAMRRCSGATGCRVFGYVDPGAVARNEALPDRQRDVPQFLLIRDMADGRVLALWDCKTASRSDPDQCLPVEPAVVRSLLRERVPAKM